MKKITKKFPNSKILVVDDYPVNAELVKEMLEMMECNVDLAEDGAIAFDLYVQHNYDLIFMDIQMPELDGYQATRKIRETEKDTNRHTKIIAITANALSGDKEKCIEAGMDDYVSKPIKGENIEEMLTKYIKQAI